MRTMLISASLAMVLGQATARPGEIPRPDVWIKNGSAEPIPVDLHRVSFDQPIRTRIENQAPLAVRLVPPTWEYRTVVVSAGSDPLGPMNALGPQGWETTGVSFVRGQDTIVLLKRQR